jgi:hypothetical protein
MVNLNVTKYSAVVAILDLRSTHFLQRTIQETFEQIFYNLQQQHVRNGFKIFFSNTTEISLENVPWNWFSRKCTKIPRLS